MTKILVIGDVHGRDDWKHITQKTEFDKVVFMGDYFDSWDIDQETQIENFLNIMIFVADMKKVGKEVITLMGNHDYHYLIEGERYSGYTIENSEKIQSLIKAFIHSGNLKICHVEGQFIFTHAGLTNTFINDVLQIEEEHFEEHLNILTNTYSYVFNAGENNSPTGDDITQGPLWVRLTSLVKDKFKPKMTQVVGHTQQQKIRYLLDDKILMVDTMAVGEYALIMFDELDSSNDIVTIIKL